jgi:hypothetical protein
MTPFIKRDSVWFGIGVGLLVPAAVYALLITIYTVLDSMGIFSDIGFAEDFRIRTIALISICANLVMMQRFRNSYRHETIRGVLIASMILVVIWFFIFGIKILNS